MLPVPIFFVVRHPIYSGFSLASLGWSLMWNSLATFIAAILLLVFFAIKARREERWLEDKFTGYNSIQIAGEEADALRFVLEPSVL
jgi:protein-S-isoprenylcysteine O-methyltransferase Ste14